MKSAAATVEEYLEELSPERREAVATVRDVVLRNLPQGYEEIMDFGMIAYVVPLSRVAKTYNGHPLMYAALASEKNYMSVHLLNVYSSEETRQWFLDRYGATGKRLDMGKSCVRFRKLADLPLELVGEAVAKTPIDDWIQFYEAVSATRKTRRTKSRPKK